MGKIIAGQKIDEILREMTDIVWVEIGVWKGQNASYAFASYDIKKMYLIDPYAPLPYLPKFFGTKKLVETSKMEAMAVLEPYKNKIVLLEDFSENVCGEIPDGSCTVLFIDGNHSYESVLLDLNNFVPKVKTGGLIIGDDFNEDGVRKAIEEYAQANGISFEVEQEHKTKTSKFFFSKGGN